MSPAAVALPDLNSLDADALRALVVEKHNELLNSRSEIEKLQVMISQLRRMQYGPSSERLASHIDQLELRLDDLEISRAAKAAPVSTTTGTPAPKRPARKPLPDSLPRENEVLEPTDTACSDCGGRLDYLGEDVSEILEYVPARSTVTVFVVTRFVSS